MKNVLRRRFLAAGTAFGIVSAFPVPALWANDVPSADSPGEELRFALIGCGGRGMLLADVVSKLPGMRLTAVCDPDRSRLGPAAQKYGLEKAFTDLRRILEDPDVDAVLIASPNHWHCLAAIWAMQAGKHVYVEKPLCLSFWEGRQVVNAAKKYRKFCQIGTQMRTDAVLHSFVKQKLHEEKLLGDIRSVRVNRSWPRRPIGLRETPCPIPEHLDYDLWLGPAQNLSLYRNRIQYDWHWMWNTGHGEMGNWGAHLLDDCRNDVLQDRVFIPKRVLCIGGRVGEKDAGETPNMALTWFDTGSIPVVFGISGLEDAQKRHFTGNTKGPRSGYVVYCEGGRYEKFWGGGVFYDSEGKKICEIAGNSEHYGAFPHIQNFADSLRNGNESALNAQIETGFHSSFWYNAPNMAYRLGRKYSKSETISFLETTGKCGCWGEVLNEMEEHLANNRIQMEDGTFTMSPCLELDAETERFVGTSAEEANRMAEMRPRRGIFAVPEV